MGLLELFLRDELLLDQKVLKSYFEVWIIGQLQVVDVFIWVVKIFKVGLNNFYCFIVFFLFVGFIGVGKIVSVKVLFEYFFGKGQCQLFLI